jgi:hypothetical protein
VFDECLEYDCRRKARKEEKRKARSENKEKYSRNDAHAEPSLYPGAFDLSATISLIKDACAWLQDS